MERPNAVSLQGQKLAYDSSWKGPWDSNVERKPRDPFVLVIFVIFFFSWLISGLFIIGLTINPPAPKQYARNSSRLLRFSAIRDPKYSERWLLYGLPIVLFCTGMTILFSVLWMYIAKIHARTITWFSLIFLVVLITLATFSPIISAFYYTRDLTSTLRTGEKNNNDTTMEALGSLCLICAVVSIICVCCMVFCHRKIDISAELIREACKAALYFPWLFLVSILEFLLTALLLFFWLFVSLSILSVFSWKTGENVLAFTDYLSILFLLVFNTTGAVWTQLFIMYFIKMITYGTIATWYWTLDKNNVDKNATSKSFKTTMSFHLGSIALGSLILTTIKMIRLLSRKASEGNDNSQGCCLGCIQWLSDKYFYLLEQAIQYMNGKAYVTCIVHGTDFFDSAKFTFQLQARNLTFAFIQNYVTDTVLYLTRALTILIPFLISYLLTQPLVNIDRYYYSISFTVFIVCILASGPFFSLINNAISAIFVSALEDWERNDGSGSKPYYMTDHLRYIMTDAAM